MKTREQAEQRALELFPDISDEDVAIESVLNHISSLKRQAYLKGWEESQDTKQTCGFCVEPKNEEE